MKIPTSKLYAKQNARIIPATHKKAVIVGTNSSGNLVSLYFVENPQSIIKNVSVSYSAQSYISYFSGDKSINIRCVVDIFDETNNSQMIVAYTY
jgi:hypothetical protein